MSACISKFRYVRNCDFLSYIQLFINQRSSMYVLNDLACLKLFYFYSVNVKDKVKEFEKRSRQIR